MKQLWTTESTNKYYTLAEFNFHERSNREQRGIDTDLKGVGIMEPGMVYGWLKKQTLELELKQQDRQNSGEEAIIWDPSLYSYTVLSTRHEEIQENEKADELSKRESETSSQKLEPAFSIPYSDVNQALGRCVIKKR